MKRRILISLVVACFILTPAVSWGFLGLGQQSQTPSLMPQGNVDEGDIPILGGQIPGSQMRDNSSPTSDDLEKITNESGLEIPQINVFLSILQGKDVDLESTLEHLNENYGIQYETVETDEGIEYKIVDVPEDVDIELEKVEGEEGKYTFKVTKTEELEEGKETTTYTIWKGELTKDEIEVVENAKEDKVLTEEKAKEEIVEKILDNESIAVTEEQAKDMADDIYEGLEKDENGKVKVEDVNKVIENIGEYLKENESVLKITDDIEAARLAEIILSVAKYAKENKVSLSNESSFDELSEGLIAKALDSVSDESELGAIYQLHIAVNALSKGYNAEQALTLANELAKAENLTVEGIDALEDAVFAVMRKGIPNNFKSFGKHNHERNLSVSDDYLKWAKKVISILDGKLADRDIDFTIDNSSFEDEEAGKNFGKAIASLVEAVVDGNAVEYVVEYLNSIGVSKEEINGVIEELSSFGPEPEDDDAEEYIGKIIEAALGNIDPDSDKSVAEQFREGVEEELGLNWDWWDYDIPDFDDGVELPPGVFEMPPPDWGDDEVPPVDLPEIPLPPELLEELEGMYKEWEHTL